MERTYIELMGFAAGTLTTLSFLPQIFKIAVSGKTRDISVYMYLALSAGIFLWLVYGVNIKELPIIIANGVSLVFCLVILVMKFVFSVVDRTGAARHREEDRG